MQELEIKEFLYESMKNIDSKSMLISPKIKYLSKKSVTVHFCNFLNVEKDLDLCM